MRKQAEKRRVFNRLEPNSLKQHNRGFFEPSRELNRRIREKNSRKNRGISCGQGRGSDAVYVRGYQGRSLSASTSILACLKHYVGYGAAEGGRDYNTTEIPERLLRDVYLPPSRLAWMTS